MNQEQFQQIVGKHDHACQCQRCHGWFSMAFMVYDKNIDMELCSPCYDFVCDQAEAEWDSQHDTEDIEQ